MKYLIDTCVIVDYLNKREPFNHAAKEIFRLVATGKIECYISSNTVTDIYYIAKKHNHDDVRTRKGISGILRLFNVIDLNGMDCAKALESSVYDYEDAVLVETAIRHGIDAIITRNIKDFVNSPIKTILPSEI